MDLLHWLERWADVSPAHPAVHFAGQDIGYPALAAEAGRLARALTGGLGLQPGERVAWLGLNSPRLLALLFACARAGLILVPLNWRLAALEHRHALADCGARTMVAEPAFIDHIDPVCTELGLPHRIAASDAPSGWSAYDEVLAAAGGTMPAAGAPNRPVLLVYTSGTTGLPRGAVLTQDALQWNAVNATQAHDLTSRDHVLTNLPMFHVGGLNIQTLPALHAGATVTLHPRFDPGTMLHDIARRRPTLALMVPATMMAVIGHADFAATDLGSLRLIMAGSSTIPAALIRAFHDRGIPVGQVYGATETAPVAIYLRAEDAMRRVGAAGKAAVHCEVRIVDGDGREAATGCGGEILVRGPNLFSGYWNDPTATAAVLRDGWFHTGDIGHRDGDGYIHIDDRKKDVIISGGENIYPAELENVLADCPGIAEAAVVARPDPRWGEVAVAVVVARPGATLDAAAVLALFEGRLARFKHPREVVFATSLPRNAMGKVLKYELRRQLRGTEPRA